MHIKLLVRSKRVYLVYHKNNVGLRFPAPTAVASAHTCSFVRERSHYRGVTISTHQLTRAVCICTPGKRQLRLCTGHDTTGTGWDILNGAGAAHQF